MKIKKFNELNEDNLHFMLGGIIKQFLSEVTGEDSIESFTKATYEQINDLHHNASTYGIYYNEDFIIFTNSESLKNWQYYAGYEYIDEQPDMIRVNGQFMAIYESDLDERIENDLDMLNNGFDEE